MLGKIVLPFGPPLVTSPAIDLIEVLVEFLISRSGIH